MTKQLRMDCSVISKLEGEQSFTSSEKLSHCSATLEVISSPSSPCFLTLSSQTSPPQWCSTRTILLITWQLTAVCIFDHLSYDKAKPRVYALWKYFCEKRKAFGGWGEELWNKLSILFTVKKCHRMTHAFGLGSLAIIVKVKADTANLTSLLCELIALEYISKGAHCRFYVSLERSS